MDSDLTARFFDADDLVPLTRLLNITYAELEAAGMNFTAATQNAWTTMQRVSSGVCWVVEYEGQLAATVTLVIPPGEEVRGLTPEALVPKRAWMEQVAVGPNLRGRQVARQLFEMASQWAVGEAYTSVGLDTAVPAKHLVQMYEKWGFQRAGTVHFAGKNYDSAVLVKALTEG